ncbi:conserved hypothetical protein [uncultured Desulfobacterium sp.]|uniref:Zinc finger/thioredoxin putative domain-containing protein n=1 Tax=uncultured Desulfobacterium sp. TaxID=201089 RepID=A0A445MVJ1_9BACT|nr:conserved hypothetical protein [uncultured Desulfobacterium sp.]
MEITCDKCNARLNIPDEKIPSGQRIAITCPKCKEKLTIEAPAALNSPEPPQAPPPAPEPSPMESYEEGTKLALVAENSTENKEKTGRSLDDIGYKCIMAESTSQAISKMRFNKLDLVLLSDHFDGIELDQNPVRQYINHISMSVRRQMFVVLVADHFTTMDQMMAFAMSANLVINRRDMDKLGGILKNAISDNENFYRVFMEALGQAGKI